MRSVMVFGCSMKLVTESMTPATMTWLGSSGKSFSTAYSCAWRGLASGSMKPPTSSLRRIGMIPCNSTSQSCGPSSVARKSAHAASIAVAWVRRQPHTVGERWHIQCAVTGYRGTAASVWSECGDRPFPPADPRGYFGARLPGARCLNSATTACPIDTT